MPHTQLPAVLLSVHHALNPEIVNCLPFLRVGRRKWVTADLLKCKCPIQEAMAEKKLLKESQIPFNDSRILTLQSSSPG
jgi:hypothetical protein